MKLLTVLFTFLYFTSLATVDIDQVRDTFSEVKEDEQSIKELYEMLQPIDRSDSKTLVAYKGAATTMMAKFAKGIRDKKNYFDQGRELIEYAISQDPNNVEIRLVRISVQENAPRILGYHGEIEQDREFVINNYQKVKDAGAKKFIRGYVSKSESFSDEQKQLF